MTCYNWNSTCLFFACKPLMDLDSNTCFNSLIIRNIWFDTILYKNYFYLFFYPTVIDILSNDTQI